MHVTLRSVCRSLRTQFVFPTLRGAISSTTRRAPDRFRVVEFSIQGDHIHLIVEAQHRAALLEGVRGLSICIARRVNKLLSRKRRFFADRWHGRALESPRAVRNALVYVLGNFRKHHRSAASLLDPYSSAPYFLGFRELVAREPSSIQNAQAPPDDPPVGRARSWLLSMGWMRHGKISIFETPKQ